MKVTQPIAEVSSETQPHTVPETSTALTTSMFHPIRGLDPDLSIEPRRTKPRVGLWSRLWTTRN
ncbi:hypothetical protein [Paeniglutamicibacter sp. Y32M11]|uniref:hypothetical protein n=1 Tax=Paeniglutamicibacter sp. Y32M11 TaxID=2853258 RepID=UPI001C532577|nr:hypothetical protein [Paeniglutamicibacter sp. Y32M11]QXQ10302.1 hypothetical protein KUF55_18090 [Paeniglutamicibacter sp. Y32M11]